MKVLVFGSKGWIGSMFSSASHHTIIAAKTRPENYEECLKEISDIRPDSVISFIGRTHGENIPTIDYLELPGKLHENMRDNFIAPRNLAEMCWTLSIHFVYLGTGCIYTYTADKKIFTEEDIPNFFGSSYSIMKGYTDQELRRYATTLQLRIRMPISRYSNPRNLINKLISYKNICSIENSMTVLDDMMPIIDTMIEQRTTGTFNLTNPGTINHVNILEQYKQYHDSSHSWTDVSYEEQMKHIKSHRSNNELSTIKLNNYCKKNNLELLPIRESFSRCIGYFNSSLPHETHTI